MSEFLEKINELVPPLFAISIAGILFRVLAAKNNGNVSPKNRAGARLSSSLSNHSRE
jgi:phosphotransferase system  glucose/maltose/N-acetylglucosamine-specific IIC component